MTQSKDKTAANSTRKRWPSLLLFASLAINLLIVGIIVGSLGGKPDRGGKDPRSMVAPYTRALSDEDRRSIGKQLRANLASRDEERGQLAQDYRATLEVLRQEPLDPVVLDEVLSRQSERANERKLIGQRALTQRLIEMTPQERAAYADRLGAELDRLAKGGDHAWRSKER